MKRKLLALLTAIMCVTSVPYTAIAKESGQYAEMKAVNVDIKQDIVEVVYNGDKILMQRLYRRRKDICTAQTAC